MKKTIIISRGRWSSITTHNLLNDYIVLCPESERDKYAEVVGEDRVETIPDSAVGLAAVRNWVINSTDMDVLMLDDDIESFYSVCDVKAKKITDKDAVDQILENTYQNAKEAGARVFGISQTADPRKYLPTEPFKLKGWVGTVIGFIGKDIKLDEKNKLRVDVDACLQCLMDYRYIWVENRFAFYGKKNLNSGGNATMRSAKRLSVEKDYLKRKWGSHIEFGEGKDTDTVKIRVSREDSIAL